MKGNPVLTLAILIGAGCSILCAPAVSGAQVLVTHRIPAALALEAVGEAVAVCAKQGYAVTAVVVDADGVRQALLRGDRAGAHTLDSAADKAYTAPRSRPIPVPSSSGRRRCQSPQYSPSCRTCS